MKTLFLVSFWALAALVPSELCFGDTLTLRNGDKVEGTYLGGTARVLRMEVNGEVQTFDIGMVTNLQFSVPAAGAIAPRSADTPPTPPPAPVRASRPSYPDSYPSSSNQPVLKRAPNSDGDSVSSSSSSSSANVPAAPPVNTDPDRPILRRAPQSSSDNAAPVQTADASGGNSSYTPPAELPPAPQPQAPVELPAGTRITVRMIDSVDSQVARVGDTFRASVDEPVSVNGTTVIPRGADVVAKLEEDDQSGRITGRTVLKLVLSSVRVNDRSIDITTSDVVKESGSRGARSAGVIGGGAVLGAIIGAAAGGGKGAAIGAGSGAAVGTSE
jgi:type IV secretory pathway VirB10-like protein